MSEEKKTGGKTSRAVPEQHGEPSAPPELTDREIYNTPIGPVCMSKTEHEAYLEELELRKLKQKK